MAGSDWIEKKLGCKTRDPEAGDSQSLGLELEETPLKRQE
jgi:hypothetical protein